MDIEKFVTEAGKWGTPERLAELVAAAQAEIPREDFFNNPAFQPVRDAWQAAAFSRAYQSHAGQAVDVRLSSQDRFPDFKLRLSGKEFDFEAVMVVTKPLGAIYRGDRGVGPVVLSELPELLPFDPAPLKAVVAKKKNKQYQGVVHLLAYINTKGGGANNEQLMKAVLETCGETFESVWLLAYGRESGVDEQIRHLVMCAKKSAHLPSREGWVA